MNSHYIRSRRPPRSRAALKHAVYFLSALALAYAGAVHAALGGTPENFGTQDATRVVRVSSAASSYLTRDTMLATGTLVREYVTDGGVVFALTWDGPILPNLKALLGTYFDAMLAESARAPRAGRSHLAVDDSEVVINSGGHMRAFEGSAWIPAAFPAGFTAADIR
jgi:hypothetical protein